MTFQQNSGKEPKLDLGVNGILSHWTWAPQLILKGNLTLRGRTTVRGS